MNLKLLQCLTVACWLGFQMDSGAFNPNFTLGSQTLQTKPTKLRVLPCTPTLLHPCLPKPTLLAQSACPSDVETLTSLMLRDLPDYANRVIQRSRPVNEDIDMNLYIIVAGRAEFQPLTLGPGSYNSVTTANVEPPQQVFFTTLERQYVEGGAIERESFHWLFLTNTDSGWRLALMFTRLGSPSPERPPTPPRESSDGIMGRAVQLWLRDCRADAIRASYR
ncbi:MAG: hypothetical protein RH949_12870 [Coleofasciculus sp. A1-SPW-01]|uniref:hypothetical protein n=1 Tax=Coleofasciculus TaxID=669368 RepID=UPI0002DC956B|nr:hypothetical protein [Coleofasciculus chthonoplastes]